MENSQYTMTDKQLVSDLVIMGDINFNIWYLYPLLVLQLDIVIRIIVLTGYITRMFYKP
jgi:hypothetical protein